MSTGCANSFVKCTANGAVRSSAGLIHCCCAATVFVTGTSSWRSARTHDWGPASQPEDERGECDRQYFQYSWLSVGARAARGRSLSRCGRARISTTCVVCRACARACVYGGCRVDVDRGIDQRRPGVQRSLRPGVYVREAIQVNLDRRCLEHARIDRANIPNHYTRTQWTTTTQSLRPTRRQHSAAMGSFTPACQVERSSPGMFTVRSLCSSRAFGRHGPRLRVVG